MWDKAAIQCLLQNSDKAVMRALMQLYRRQTASERQMHATTDANGIGFNARDAEVLSDIASRVPRYGRLTPNQTRLVRAKLLKYHRQLAEIANESGAPVPEAVLVKLGRAVAPQAQQAVPDEVVIADDLRTAEEQAHDAYLSQLAAAGMVAIGDAI